ncbi:MAG TPA: hypothetical protein VGO66_02625 [Solirubrobacterales bacterium]|nr:hypothetical protein [Solirubrobacterales bacterium]
MAKPTAPGLLAKFAELHGLAFAPSADLPAQGDTLSRDGGKAEGVAGGTLPGGIEGTLAHFVYVYTWTDSDNHSHSEDRRFTLVVTRIPESIGFLPYLGFSGPDSKLSARAGGEDMAPIDMSKSEVLKHATAMAYKGTRETWLAQLLSPALVQWLERCDGDFGFELANGVLCAGRSGYLSDPHELEAVCADAAHLATAIREESLEEVGTGGEEAEAATDPDAVDPQMETALRDVELDSPANTGAAKGAFKSYARRAPATSFGALRFALLLSLGLNIPAAAIPIILISEGAYLPLALIEGALVLTVFFFSFRSRVRQRSSKYAEEAFYRAYATDRELKLEEPLHFAATHAEAKLPFKPDRVLSGPLPGGSNGSLTLTGDGAKRSDRIAIVAGPTGPVAETELQAEAEGISAKLLDGYAARLAKEVAEDLATRPPA